MTKTMADLVRALKKDNKDEDWEKLYKACDSKILYWAAGNEDVAQLVWIKVLKNIHKFDVNKDFLPWVKTIAVNTLIDHNRSLEYRLTVNLSQDDILLVDDTDFLDVALEKEETYDLVRQALEDVMEENPKYGRALDLYSRGYTYMQISEICKTPMGTINRIIHYAKGLFKEKLLGYGIHKYPFDGE